MPAHYAATDYALGILHRDTALPAFDKDYKGHDGDHQRNQEDQREPSERPPRRCLGLDVQVIDSVRQTDDDTGMSIRFVRAWDQRESKMTNRYDMAYGFGNFYADNAGICIAGA